MDVEKIHETLQSLAPQDDSDLKDALLVKWVVVMDWINPEGQRVLTRRCAENMTRWEVEGLVRYSWR